MEELCGSNGCFCACYCVDGKDNGTLQKEYLVLVVMVGVVKWGLKLEETFV